MPTTPTASAIRSRIDAFLADIAALVKGQALESVTAALGDGGAPRRRGPGRPRGKAKRRPRKAARAKPAKRGKRTSEQVEAVAARVLSHVKANPGLGVEQIGKALRLPTKVLALPVVKLLAAKAIRTTGQRRGTRYFAGAGRKRTVKLRRRAKAKARRRMKRAVRVVRRRATRRKAKAAAPVAAPVAAA